MKNLLFLLLFALPLMAASQGFRAGTLLGVNATQVDGDNLSGYNKLGLNAGFFVYYPLKKDKWRLQMEMAYSSKGALRPADENYVSQPGSIDKLAFHYIEVPLLLGYSYKKFNIYLGVSGAYLFYARRKDFSGVHTVTNSLKPFEIAYHLRAEYELTKRLAVNAGMSYSLNCLSLTFCDPLWTNPRLRQGYHNNMLQLSLRYLFQEK